MYVLSFFSLRARADAPIAVQEASKTRDLVVISGFIHDVSSFMDEHPGGKAFVKTRLGKDATTAFYGGVYDHSNAAGAVLSMLRVGCIEGGCTSLPPFLLEPTLTLCFADEVESLKKYSEVINSLLVSGGEGVAGKSADISATDRKSVV